MASKRAASSSAAKPPSVKRRAKATADQVQLPSVEPVGSEASFGTHQGKALAELLKGQTCHPSMFLVNAAHWQNVERAYQTIIEHPVFNGIAGELPLALGSSSVAPFKVSDFRAAVNGPTGCYTCGANAMWQSPFFTTTPGVPINTRSVRPLSSQHHCCVCCDAPPLFCELVGDACAL